MNASNLTQLRPKSARSGDTSTNMLENSENRSRNPSNRSRTPSVTSHNRSRNISVTSDNPSIHSTKSSETGVGHRIPYIDNSNEIRPNLSDIHVEFRNGSDGRHRVESLDKSRTNSDSRERANSDIRERANSVSRERANSGSYGGAYESDEEIANAGMIHSSSLNGEYEAIGHSTPRRGVGEAGMGHLEPEEERIKRKLKFYFMNPVDKYRATKKIPWKLMLQILKVFIVTAQLWIFANFRYAHVNYYTDQTIAFQHFFIKDWDAVREIHAYPPATGKLAIYKKSEFYNFVDFSVETFKNIESNSFSPFFRNSSFGLCVEHFRNGNISKDLHFDLNMELVTDCLFIQEDHLETFNGTELWLEKNNFMMPWTAVERISLNFSLTSVTLRPLGPLEGPDCFKFKVGIHFDNRHHDGQIPIELISDPDRLMCPGEDMKQNKTYYPILVVLFNLVVIGFCTGSLLLCVRALIRAQLLKHEAMSYLDHHKGWTLTNSEKLSFLNFWYVMICVNDTLIIMASIIKQLVEVHSIEGDMWDICSLMLGTGNLLVWFGLLRYLGFFKTYNVLILTMKGAAPNVLRFLICASFIYFGFVFAGWVILGPYHFKFETIMSTSECLFSLINGDDMFATFNSIPRERALSVWIYSRVYLYFFISLFIYVILSLFISIIMDTYEIIKDNYNKGFPCGRLEKFYETSEFDFSSGRYARDSMSSRVRNLMLRSGWMPSRTGYEEIS